MVSSRLESQILRDYWTDLQDLTFKLKGVTSRFAEIIFFSIDNPQRTVYALKHFIKPGDFFRELSPNYPYKPPLAYRRTRPWPR